MKLLADYKLKIKPVECAFPFRWVKFASNIKLFFSLRSKSMGKMWYFQWNRWLFEEAILKVVNSSENQLLSFILKFDLSWIMKARNIHSKYWLHVPMQSPTRFFFAGQNRCVNFEFLRCAHRIHFISITNSVITFLYSGEYSKIAVKCLRDLSKLGLFFRNANLRRSSQLWLTDMFNFPRLVNSLTSLSVVVFIISPWIIFITLTCKNRWCFYKKKNGFCKFCGKKNWKKQANKKKNSLGRRSMFAGILSEIPPVTRNLSATASSFLIGCIIFGMSWCRGLRRRDEWHGININ